ncbi:MAG: PEP-CTERM sorting domain-containing protein [Dechloromonas sp.]|nr:PEP-CTERM sorting domain-containing protein [Dechloromonas sp.]
MKKISSVVAGCLSLALCGSVSAATTWTSWSVGTQSVVNGVAASASATGTTATVSTSGWANTRNGTNTELEKQNLISYSPGLGLKNNDINAGDPNESSHPWHAIDNQERYEMALLSFTNGPVNLQSAVFSYVGYDADYTVLAYTGNDGAQGFSSGTWGAGVTWSSLPTGWNVISNGNVSIPSAQQNSTGTFSQSFANSTYSSYWLIGASLSSPDRNDAFKLSSIAGCATAKSGVGQSSSCGGTSNGVPEPGSLLLAGVGLLGLIRMRRKKEVSTR